VQRYTFFQKKNCNRTENVTKFNGKAGESAVSLVTFARLNRRRCRPRRLHHEGHDEGELHRGGGLFV